MSSSSSDTRAEGGFTLIEVMITMAILSFISLGIYQTVTSAFQLREELSQDSDFQTGIRLAMGIMSQDISLAYSPTILVPYQQLYPGAPQPGAQGMPNSRPSPSPSPSPLGAGLPENVAADLSQSFTYWGQALNNSGLRPSRFIGSESKITFISASNDRIYRDSPESIFAKVSYESRPDEDPPTDGFKVSDSSVLVKTVSADAFDNDDERNKPFEHVYPMLRGITQFHFTYYRWRDDSFTAYKTWDSDLDDYKYQLPDVIEVTIQVKGPGNQSFDGTYRFKPEIPLRGLYPSF